MDHSIIVLTPQYDGLSPFLLDQATVKDIVHILWSGRHLKSSSPLAQTWHDRALFSATYIDELAKQDHIPVLSRQGGPPLYATLSGSTA